MNTFKKFQNKKDIEEPEVQLMFGVSLIPQRKKKEELSGLLFSGRLSR